MKHTRRRVPLQKSKETWTSRFTHAYACIPYRKLASPVRSREHVVPHCCRITAFKGRHRDGWEIVSSVIVYVANYCAIRSPGVAYRLQQINLRRTSPRAPLKHRVLLRGQCSSSRAARRPAASFCRHNAAYARDTAILSTGIAMIGYRQNAVASTFNWGIKFAVFSHLGNRGDQEKNWPMRNNISVVAPWKMLC